MPAVFAIRFCLFYGMPSYDAMELTFVVGEEACAEGGDFPPMAGQTPQEAGRTPTPSREPDFE